jgi:hypothetical protein
MERKVTAVAKRTKSRKLAKASLRNERSQDKRRRNEKRIIEMSEFDP